MTEKNKIQSNCSKTFVDPKVAAENRRKIGNEGESEACRYLKENGYQIVCRNYRSGRNEIDIIACDKRYILFIEVKTRSQKNYAEAARAVNLKKRHGLIRAAKAFIASNPCFTEKFPSFDVMEIYNNKDPLSQPEINHIKNAFDASGNVIL